VLASYRYSTLYPSSSFCRTDGTQREWQLQLGPMQHATYAATRPLLLVPSWCFLWHFIGELPGR